MTKAAQWVADEMGLQIPEASSLFSDDLECKGTEAKVGYDLTKI